MSGHDGGQRPRAAYYSHCSPNDRSGLLRISKASEQVHSQKLASRLFCLSRVGVNGKRKLNFLLKFNSLTWSCFCCLRSTPRSPFFPPHFVFFRGLDPAAASSYLATLTEQSRASALSSGGTFPRGKSPSLHLGLCT